MARAVTRGVRSDGARSRSEILHTAAMFATVRGIDQLSIGELAAKVGMSKSGLYAHFGSKEELQLATVAAAAEIFEHEVLAPARLVPVGRDGLIALSDAFLDHLRNRVFPGGCFFDSAAADLHARAGPVRDAVGTFQASWRGLVAEHLAPRWRPGTCRRTRTSSRSNSTSSPTTRSPTPCSRSSATRRTSTAPPGANAARRGPGEAPRRRECRRPSHPPALFDQRYRV